MEPEGIKAELRGRLERQSNTAALDKILPVAMKRYGVESSYDLDTLITMFFMNQFLPMMNDVETHMERIVEELSQEKGFTDPSYEEVARRYMEEVFSNLGGASKVLIGSLFGELDGDADVEEYVNFRADEFRNFQMSTRKFLEREKRDRA